MINESLYPLNTIFSTFTEENDEYDIYAKINEHTYCTIYEPRQITFRCIDGNESQQHMGCCKTDNRYKEIPGCTTPI